LQATLRLRADTEKLQQECAEFTPADQLRLKSQSGTMHRLFYVLFTTILRPFYNNMPVQRERSGFSGVWLPVDVHGIHLAAGPDFMHLMLEGIADTLITCIVKFLNKRGE
jgi:hypothetical protein